jgi:hypothetical protein
MTAQQSNSNTVWFNFQRVYIYIYNMFSEPCYRSPCYLGFLRPYSEIR